LRDFRELSIHPRLKATEGAEVITLHRAWAFPGRNSQPTFEHLAG